MNVIEATSNMEEFEDDIFDRNIDQLDVRETPRWELSEEEPSGDSDVETLVNQQKGERKSSGGVKIPAKQQHSPQVLSAAATTQRPNMGIPELSPSPNAPHRQASIPAILKHGPPQSPLLKKVPSVPHSTASTTESVQTVMSPLYGRKMDKAKIDALLKDFGAVERTKQSGTKLRNVSAPGDPKAINPTAAKDIMKKLPPWEDDDADSIKDFTSTDRKKEEKYMERTDEAIYKRASEEHIKRPPIWHDEEVDSLRDFGRISGKQEIPSGMTSQQISRVPSDDELCLSPPWNDEDDGPVRNFACSEHKSYGINKMVTEEGMHQAPPWHEEDDMDSTRDYAEFCKIASIENSRRPSEENIYLTPPWMEDDRDSCTSINNPSAHMTLEEKRAIEEEARHSGVAEASKKAEALRDEKGQDGTGTSQQIPGRDSGFCSEQDQHGQQGQAPVNTVLPDKEAGEQEFPTIADPIEELPGPPSVPSAPVSRSSPPVAFTTAVSVSPLYSNAPLPPSNVHNANKPVMATAAVNPVVRVSNGELPRVVHQQSLERSPMVRQQNIGLANVIRQQKPEVSKVVQKQGLEGNRVGLPRQASGEAPRTAQQQNRMVRQQSLEVPRMTGNQHDNGVPITGVPTVHGSGPRQRVTHQRDEALDNRIYGMACASNKGIARSISQSSLEANCYSPHDALEGLETSSVVSFASTAATHHDLDTRIDMMQSLLSLLGTHDKDDMSRTLLAMSNSKDSCAAMRQSGCLPLLIDLLHGRDNPLARRDSRARAGLALHNIVYSNVEDRRGRREIRVLRLLEIVRAHCDVVYYGDLPPHPCAERWYPPLRDYGPGPAVAALMKLSFEEEHRTAICELGGLHAIAELIEIDHKVNAQCKDFYSISLRKYAGMTLTNLTFGNTKNKTILCKMEKTLMALIAQLGTVEEEEIIQVAASVLRNLSWRADDICREALKTAGTTKALMEACQDVNGEAALRTILSGLWNLSAHCTENKTDLCTVPGAMKFLVKCLSYCSPTGNISVVESSGGILRNLSSHIAVRPEYRLTLRENGCFHTLLSHLRSPSLRVVSNACGALWNLSARSAEDQELLWELGAVSLLKSLVNSKHKAISMASSAALRNLMTVKPTSSNGTDSESVSSRNARRYRSLPAASRSHEAQSKIKNSGRGIVRSSVTQSSRLRLSQTKSPQNQSPITQSPRAESPVVHTNPELVQASRMQHGDFRTASASGGQDNEAVVSIVHSQSSVGSTKENGDENLSPLLSRSRSDIGPRPKRCHKGGSNAVDSSSIGSGASVEGRRNHLGRWSESNDSLARHRRQNNSIRIVQPAATSGHSRSSSDGCTVIQLLTDSYPLQVSKTMPKIKPTMEGATSRVRHALGYTGSQPSVLPGRHSDSTSVVSPGTARRLNQWAEIQASESIEMSNLSMRLRVENQNRISKNAPVVASRESVSSSTSRQRRRRAQKFRSYRDTDSDPEADIDSDDDRTVFSARGNSGTGNAWVHKTGSRSLLRGRTSGSQASTVTQSPRLPQRMNDKTYCVCNDVSNIWIKRPNSGESSPRGVCEKCNGGNLQGRGENADSRTIVKTRRNSSDSPLSSPSTLRGLRVKFDHENIEETDPTKRGVKVTSL